MGADSQRPRLASGPPCTFLLAMRTVTDFGLERSRRDAERRSRRDAKLILALEARLRDLDDLRRGIIVHLAALPPGRNVQADAMFDIAASMRAILK